MKIKTVSGILFSSLIVLSCADKSALLSKGEERVEPVPADVTTTAKRISGSRVSMWLPEGMHRPSRALTLVLDNPPLIVNWAEITTHGKVAIESGVLEGIKKGWKISESEDIKRGGATGFVGTGPGAIDGFTRRMIGLAAGESAAGIAVDFITESAEQAERIIDSAELAQNAELDPLAMYGIEIGDLAGFEVQEMANLIMLREIGARPPLRPGAPGLSIFFHPLSKQDMSAKERDRMLGGALRGALSVFNPDFDRFQSAKIEIDGKQGQLVSGPGKRNGTVLTLFGFMVPDEGSGMIGFGSADQGVAEDVLPRFERILKSLRFDDRVLGPIK